MRNRWTTVGFCALGRRTCSVRDTGGDAKKTWESAVASDIFRVLGIPPLLGRTFTQDEDRTGARVIVLTYDAWQHYFNRDPSIIGREVLCSLRPYTVIGVMPAGYRYPIGPRCEYFMPLQRLVPDSVKNRSSHFLRLVGRLNPGASVKQASAEISAIGGRMEKQFPDNNTGRTYYAISLHHDLVGDVRPALLTIVSAVVLVLLIACANVANLLLARANQRRREIAIRTALGASRLRIVTQLLTEGVVLALLGACFGLLLAWRGIDLLRLFGPRDVPRPDDIRINAVVIVFALVAAVASTLLFAVFPALQVSRPNVNESLQEGSRGAVGPESHRARSLLIIAQVALSMLLLAGAGLLIKSFSNLRATNPGFEPSQVLTLDLALPRTKYADLPLKQQEFFERLYGRLRTLPGIEAAGGVTPLPFSGNDRAPLFGSRAGPTPVPATIRMRRISPSWVITLARCIFRSWPDALSILA